MFCDVVLHAASSGGKEVRQSENLLDITPPTTSSSTAWLSSLLITSGVHLLLLLLRENVLGNTCIFVECWDMMAEKKNRRIS